MWGLELFDKVENYPSLGWIAWSAWTCGEGCTEL